MHVNARAILPHFFEFRIDLYILYAVIYCFCFLASIRIMQSIVNINEKIGGGAYGIRVDRIVE